MRISASKPLEGKITIPDPQDVDLEAFLQKPGPPEVSQFQVMTNYVAALRNLFLEVNQTYRLPLGFVWIRGVLNSSSAPFLWLLFNAALIKLALILSKAREEKRTRRQTSTAAEAA